MGAHVFEVCVSHVVDAEDVDVGVEGDAFLDVGVEAEGQFFALFLRFGEMDDLCAFGFRHFRKVIWGNCGSNKCRMRGKYCGFNFLIGLWDAKISRQGLDTADVYPKPPRVIVILYGVRCELKIDCSPSLFRWRA